MTQDEQLRRSLDTPTEADFRARAELVEAERDEYKARVEVLEGLLKRALPYIKNVAHSDRGGYSEDNPWLWEEMKLALGFEVRNWAKDQIAALVPAESGEEPTMAEGESDYQRAVRVRAETDHILELTSSLGREREGRLIAAAELAAALARVEVLEKLTAKRREAFSVSIDLLKACQLHMPSRYQERMAQVIAAGLAALASAESAE